VKRKKYVYLICRKAPYKSKNDSDGSEIIDCWYIGKGPAWTLAIDKAAFFRSVELAESRLFMIVCEYPALIGCATVVRALKRPPMIEAR
jgi:hypothetical protein